MGSNDNGITQSPWEGAPVPTPDAGSGTQGTGGGLDQGAGASGLTQVPWTGAPVPTPSGDAGSSPFGNPARFSDLDGSTHQGETLANDITMPPMHTIDKK